MRHTSLRLEDEDSQLIEKLAKHYGVSRTGVIRMLLRKCAREEKITLEETATEQRVNTAQLVN